jgi:hypothetical protein
MLNKIGDIFLLLNIALRSKLAALLVMVNLPLAPTSGVPRSFCWAARCQ